MPSKQKKLQDKIRNARRHKFLLTFFEEPHEYSHKEINGFILVRQFNKGTDRWEVAIFDKDSWERKNQYVQGNLVQ